MRSYTTVRSASAIALGACCAIGTLITLFWHVRSPSDITPNHVFILLALMCALGGAHFTVRALKERCFGSALFFCFVFLAAGSVCAIMAAGRGAETLIARQATVAHADGHRLNHERKIIEAKADKESARAAADKAQANAEGKQEAAAQECKSGRKSRCEGVTYTAEQAAGQAALLAKRAEGADARYWTLVAQLAEFKPIIPANVELKNAAKLWALITGYDEGKSNEALELLWPLLLSYLTEIGTVAFLHYGIGHARREFPAVRQLPAPSATVSTPRKPVKPLKQRRPGDFELVQTALARAGRPVTNDELATLLNVTKGEASKTVTGLEGAVRRVRFGRHVAISL